MATVDDVKKLAALSRIELKDAQLQKFTNEFDSILAYVSQLESLELPSAGSEKPQLRNVMRVEGEPHPSGIYTEKIAAQFPAREGDALVVKQIIKHE